MIYLCQVCISYFHAGIDDAVITWFDDDDREIGRRPSETRRGSWVNNNNDINNDNNNNDNNNDIQPIQSFANNDMVCIIVILLLFKLYI